LPTDKLWFLTEPLLPSPKRVPGGRGRPQKSDHKMFLAIFYVLRTGIQWNALPRCLGAPSTVHDRFQQWQKAGVFKRLWENGILQLHVEDRLDWSYQSIDGAMTKAPLGQAATGANPTDRGKKGVKRHLLTEANGFPIGLSITGANVHDISEVTTVLTNMPFLPPFPTEKAPQGFCADKAYDSEAVRRLIENLGYENHIKSRWDEKEALAKVPGYRARRWVCERTHSWINRFRRLLIRWEKKIENYEAMLHLCFAHIIWNHTNLFSG
jgi:putative transposase